MLVYGNVDRLETLPKIDTEIIAFYVTDEDKDYIIEHLTSAIVSRCLMIHGTPPEIID